MLEGSIKALGLKMKYALQTHAHFDHTFGLPFIYRTYGLKPIFHVDDAETYRDMGDEERAAKYFDLARELNPDE